MLIFILIINLFCGYFLLNAELCGSFVLPDFESKDAFTGKTEYQFRRKATLLIAPDSLGKISLLLESRQIGKNTTPLQFIIKDKKGNVLEAGNVLIGNCHAIDFINLSKGVYHMVLNAGGNAAKIKIKAGRCSFEVHNDSPLRPYMFKDKLFFCVNRGRFVMEAFGSTPNEHIEITIRDHDNKTVFKGNSLNRRALKIPINIPIPEDQIGKIWSIQFNHVGWQKFEDMGLSIESGASPVVALSPEQLIIPMFNKESKILENGNGFVGISVSQYLKKKKGYSGTFSFKEASWRSKPLQVKINLDESWSTTAFCQGEENRHFEIRNNAVGDSNHLVGLEYSRDILLCGEAHFIAYDEKKRPISEIRWNFAACNGREFLEVPQKEPIPIAVQEVEDISRGFLFFQREEPGFIRLNSRPAQSELCHEIMGETSSGLVSCEFFTFLPIKACIPHVSIGKLSGPVDIPEEAVKLLSVRMWPQQLGKKGTYAIIPELLVKEDFPTWDENIPYQYCIRVSVPKDCPAGTYTAPILLNGKKCAVYKLVVDDFILPEYHDMTFGLYADGQRWLKQNFTDDEILREMKIFREHGVNALMQYPLSGSIISYDKGKIQVDLSKFKRIMSLYQQIGFPGITVFSLQGLDSRLSKVLGKSVNMLSSEYEAGLKTVLEALRKMGKEEKWPDYCIHVIDEPTLKRGVKEAETSLKIVKQAGFKTFNTCYEEVVREKLAHWLDYRCYSNSGFHSSKTREANDRLRKETLDDGDAFWWYGAGCYAPIGGGQDGNIYSNRHMLGIFNWRSGATGAWSWTFLRFFGSPYNDFDDEDKGSSTKEQCICYPSVEGHDIIDTLQWEAIREGIYDYRYIRYWDELCKKSAEKPHFRRAVSKSRRRISKTMDSISWNSLNFTVSNVQLCNLRKELIQEIKSLRIIQK